MNKSTENLLLQEAGEKKIIHFVSSWISGGVGGLPPCFFAIFAEKSLSMTAATTHNDFAPLAEWLTLHHGLLFVAGPCSVESREQLDATARQLAGTGKVSVLRAGVWKPRSRPGRFEGMGEEALPWLRDIKAETGLPVAVEVARPAHAELCLEYKADMIWLGARTTVNPFMVQEIANAIKGTGIPVMIKNPVSPDLRLWIGAIERIVLAGSRNLIAIHRGFQTHQKSVYRNLPLWDIPMALQNKMPNLPIICDPSHIAGDIRWIPEVAMRAIALQMHGLMVETHHNPPAALTDPLQQITPSEFNILIQKIAGRKDPSKKESRSLENLRSQIDEHDQALLEIIASRLTLSKQAGKIKGQLGVDILQPARQQDLFADRLKKAERLGLCPGFVEKIITLLHEQSVEVQAKVRGKNSTC